VRGANKESIRRNGKALTMKLRPRRREYLRLVLPRGDQKCGAFPCRSSDQTYAANSIPEVPIVPQRDQDERNRRGEACCGMVYTCEYCNASQWASCALRARPWILVDEPAPATQRLVNATRHTPQPVRFRNFGSWIGLWIAILYM
jgi:hypothetical protein